MREVGNTENVAAFTEKLAMGKGLYLVVDLSFGITLSLEKSQLGEKNKEQAMIEI